MVFSMVGTKTEKKQSLIDGREAFNLWDLLRAKYMLLEKLKVWEKTARDPELKRILNALQSSFQENVSLLEKQMKTYAITAPDQNKAAMGYPISPQAVTDEFVAGEIFIALQEHLENTLKSFRTSITNDVIRGIFKKITLKAVDHNEKYIQYLKAKGWLEVPPIYKNTDPSIKEIITTVEAISLWDHLTLRYDNMRATDLYLSFAYDGDFKVTLKVGMQTLKRQANLLEKELEYFGIPLPKRSSLITANPSSTQLITDDHMYRTLLLGLRTVVMVHAQTLKECIFNDRVRGIFKQLLIDELNYIDNYYKFGKMKGWFHEIPMYV